MTSIEVCKDIGDIPHANRRATIEEVGNWISLDDDAVMSQLAWLFVDHNDRVCKDARNTLADALIPYLVNQIATGSSELRRSEGLVYLANCFCYFWQQEPCDIKRITEIKDGLGRLLAQLPDQEKDLVTLIVLEHLFAIPEVIQFFSDWAVNSELKAAFSEALQLSADYRTDD